MLTAGSFGLEIAAYIGVGFMGGPWLDHRFHTAPWFKILGYIIGIGAPINAFIRIIRDYNRSLKNDQSQLHDDRRDKPSHQPDPSDDR